MPERDWKLSESALRAGATAADTIGVERNRRAKDLAAGRIVDQNGIELGKFKSDAETGFVLCIKHGFAKAVDGKGVWRETGTCEWCWKQGHSPEAIASRKAEVGERYERERQQRIAAQLAEEQAQIEAHRAAVDALGEDGQSEALDGAVDARPDPPVRVPERAPSGGVDGPHRVEPGPAPRGPTPGPSSVGSDLETEWSDPFCLGPDLPARESPPTAEGARAVPAPAPAPKEHPLGWVFGRRPRRDFRPQG